MDDATFEEIRTALAADRDKTSRLGALYLLELSHDGDERVAPLLATLLRERQADLLAAVAAVAMRYEDLRRMLERDLARVWSIGLPEYRAFLLQAMDGDSLGRMAMQYAAVPDEMLKLGLLARLDEIPDAVTRRDAALYLSRDGSAEIRTRAMAALVTVADAELAEERAAIDGMAPRRGDGFSVMSAGGGQEKVNLRPSVRAASMRLMADPVPEVRIEAARGLAAACSPDEARELLAKMGADTDMDVREAVVNLQRTVQQRANIAHVEPLVARQAELVDAGEYNKAMAVAAQVFMRVANHGGCQFQMARAAAGLGDVRRSLHLLANAFQAGFRDMDAVMAEPLLAPARATEAWAEVLAMAPKGLCQSS